MMVVENTKEYKAWEKALKAHREVRDDFMKVWQAWKKDEDAHRKAFKKNHRHTTKSRSRFRGSKKKIPNFHSWGFKNQVLVLIGKP